MEQYFQVNKHLFELLPEKAIYWQNKNALLLSDLHFGKSTHFRKNGIPIHTQVAQNDFDKCHYLIEKFNPETVYFLGDLFHSQINTEWNHFVALLENFRKTTFILLKGNHDIIDSKMYESLGIAIYHSLLIEGILLSHDETNEPDCFNLYGHIHPGIKLTGKAKQSVRLPCFYFGPSFGILPAFSNFTGLKTLPIGKASAIFAIADNAVIKVK